MDFARLVGGQDSALTRQLAEQLLSNAIFRDAAIKAAGNAEEAGDNPSNASSEAPSGLDNLLDQLTSALTQAAEAAEPDAVPTQSNGVGIETLLNHPLVRQALSTVPAELSLAVKVALGQIPPELAERALGLLNAIPASTVNKVESVLKNLSNEDLERGVNFFQALFNHEKMVFTKAGNADNYLDSANQNIVNGADLNKFLQTAYYVAASGYDIGKFLDNATNALKKGDYDDFQRLLSVTDMALYKGEDMDAFFDYGNQVLDSNPHDYESNLFQMYTIMAHGGRVADHIDIANNLKTTGAEGRNNLVDLTRITIDFKNLGGYTPALFNMLATEAREGGNVRALMDEYMADRGMPHTGPDFTKYDRIERIDGDPMVIKQGEKAAIFAQAVSSASGLLPESVLYWSSKETGAMAQGSSHLDLSKLPPGTYHIAVKIGGYSGGTDTALKTVIVEPADGSTTIDSGNQTPAPAQPEIVVPMSGKVKIQIPVRANPPQNLDLYMQTNGQSAQPVGQNANSGLNQTLQQPVQAGDKLDFSLRIPGGTVNLSATKVEQLSDSSWQVTFGEADDPNAIVVTIEIVADDPFSGEGGDEGPVVGGAAPSEPAAPPVVPLSKDEAMQVTRDALSSLNAGASAASVASTLNERYYAALDGLIESNQAYAQQVDEVRESASGLKALMQQVLRDLRASTGYNPYV